MRIATILSALSLIAGARAQSQSLSFDGFLPNPGQFPPAIRFVHYSTNNFFYLTRDSFVLSNGVRIQIAGLNASAQPAGVSPTSTLFNSYPGQDPVNWIVGGHLFGGVMLNNAYPGVDAEFTISPNPPPNDVNDLGEITFSIAPGAGPSPITLNVLNIGTTPFVGPAGEIWYTGGSIPGVFALSAQATQTSGQNSSPVSCNLIINPSGSLSIQLPDYNPALPTTVVIAFPDGDIYARPPSVGPVFSSITYPSNFGQDGSLPNATCGNTCGGLVVANVTSSGTPLWITVFGGSDDSPFYVTGTPGLVNVSASTASADLPVTTAAPYARPASPGDVYLASFDAASGQLRNATYAGLNNGGAVSQQLASSNGDIAVSAGTDILLWQPPTNQLIYHFTTPAPVVALAFDTSGNLFFTSEQTPATGIVLSAGELNSSGTLQGTLANIDLQPTTLVQPVLLQPGGSNGLWVVYQVLPGSSIAPGLWVARVLPASGQTAANVQVLDQGSVVDTGQTPAGNLKLLVETPTFTEPTTPNAALVAGCPNTSYFLILSPAGQRVYASYVPTQSFNLATQNESAGPPQASVACFASTAGRSTFVGAAPGELITITGGGFGPASPVYTAPGADGKYPFTAAGLSVTIAGLQAPVIAVADGLIAAQVPFEIPLTYGSPLPVDVFQDGAEFASISLFPTDNSLNLFDTGDSNNSIGLPALAALNQDGTANSAANPAAVGSVVSLFATGLGILSPPLKTGALNPIPPAGPLSITQIPSACSFDAPQAFDFILCQVLYIGSAPGLSTSVAQINVQLPSTVPGTGVRPLGTGVGVYYNGQYIFSDPTGVIFIQ